MPTSYRNSLTSLVDDPTVKWLLLSGIVSWFHSAINEGKPDQIWSKTFPVSRLDSSVIGGSTRRIELIYNVEALTLYASSCKISALRTWSSIWYASKTRFSHTRIQPFPTIGWICSWAGKAQKMLKLSLISRQVAFVTNHQLFINLNKMSDSKIWTATCLASA